MKKILILLLVFLTAISSEAQDKLFDILPIKDGIVTYTGVVQIDSVDRDQLYFRAKKWFVMTYKSANDVLQLDDKENGEIIGKGNLGIKYYSRSPYIFHTISISVKDERFKYTINGLKYSDNVNDKFVIEDFPKSWGSKGKTLLYEEVDREMKSLIVSLETFMKSKPKDDW